MSEPHTTFWDSCIASLPPGKRAAAERAYAELAGGGEASQSAKLFLLLEAYATYTHGTLERKGEARAPGAVESAIGKADLENLLGAVRAADVRQPVAEAKAKMDAVDEQVKRLNGQISRLRVFRVGMALLLMVIAAILALGVGWYWNRAALDNAKELKQTGHKMEIMRQQDNLVIFIYGANGQVRIINDEQRQGVGAVFPIR